jgi:hypothetical protein
MSCDSEEVLDNKPRSGQNLHVQEVLQIGHEHLKKLMAQRAEITRQIATAKTVLIGLTSMYGSELANPELQQLLGGNGPRNWGLTDACRRILLEAQEPLGARAVRDRLLEMDRDLLQHHKHPTASIVTVLTRLVAYGEARVVPNGSQRAWASAKD